MPHPTAPNKNLTLFLSENVLAIAKRLVDVEKRMEALCLLERDRGMPAPEGDEPTRGVVRRLFRSLFDTSDTHGEQLKALERRITDLERRPGE